MVIITGGTVKATGGENAAGIGGGGNPLGKNVTGGQSGTIIIAGNAAVTAQGGQNAPGIGAGGAQSQNDYNANAAKVQAIIITTTGNVDARGGQNATTNIGSGKLGNNNTPADRYVGSVIVNTSNAVITGALDNMPNTVTRDANGDLVVRGNVDLVNNTRTASESETISQGIANYLTNNSKNIVAGSPTPSLTVTQSQQGTVNAKAQSSGVSVNGSTVTKYTVSASSNNPSVGSVSWSSQQFAVGATASITATVTNSAYVLDGWYVSGSKVSGNTTYSFRVNGAMNIEARFTIRPTQPPTGGGDQGSGSGSGSGSGTGGGSSSGGGTTGGGTTGGGNGSSSSPVDRLNDGIAASFDPETIKDRIDVNGPNAIVFNARGEVAAVNNTIADATTLSVARGNPFTIELFHFDGSIDTLKADASPMLTMDIWSGGEIVASLTQTKQMNGGYVAFEVQTSSLNDTSTAEALSTRGVGGLEARITGFANDAEVVMPFSLYEPAFEGSSGGECDMGAPFALVLALLVAMAMYRSFSYKCRH